MSRIYFHSPSEDVEVGGSERHYMASVVETIATSILWSQVDIHSLGRFLPNCYAKTELERMPKLKHFNESLDLWWRISLGEDHNVHIGGKKYDVWELTLNTALALGSDPVKLFARLHAQCEIHCFVKGKNRNWLADIIEEGVGSGLYRDSEYGQGTGPQWSNVVKLLRSSKKDPVVCSYSVCEQFPNAYIAGYRGNECDKFYDLPDARKWDLAMKGLLKTSGGLELKPDYWRVFKFGHSKDILWLAEAVREATREPVSPNFTMSLTDPNYPMGGTE